ncbi:MAG: ECF-type sigma factor [Roseibacillus sp.]|nr:ECF-type sigma factor [Roseibacillus sp.]
MRQFPQFAAGKLFASCLIDRTNTISEPERTLDDITRILCSLEEGTCTAGDLLPAVYEELRRLARSKMAGERPDHTLQATALVHEVWIRLERSSAGSWQNRNHFFGAAAEAMRRILVDHARKHLSQKRGSGAQKVELDSALSSIVVKAPREELIAIHEALDKLEEEDPQVSQLVKLRYFVGMTMAEAADAMDLKKRSAEALWTYGKAWLHREIKKKP